MNLPDSSKPLAANDPGQADVPQSSIDRIAAQAALCKPPGKPGEMGPCFSYHPGDLHPCFRY